MEISNIGDTSSKKNTIINIDNKVEIKNQKEKKGTRTYIIGLEHFLSSDECNELCKTLKKKLGSACVIKEEDEIKQYGFQGNHIDNIAKYLKEKNIVPVDKIIY